MRIGMILDAPFPPDPRVENEAISLLQAGHEIYLFSLDFDQQRSGTEIYRGIYIVRYPAGRFIYKLSALSYTIPVYRWKVSSLIARFIKSFRIEALHVHDMVIAEAAFRANRSFKLPVVLDYHENRPEIMKQYRHVNSFFGKIFIDLRKWTRKYYELAIQAQRVVVVTEASKRDIVTRTKKKPEHIAVVPNSVNPDEFLNQSIRKDIIEKMEDSFNLLYIGDTSLRRGTATSIAAIALLKDILPNIKLWFIGKGSADEELKELARKSGVSARVIFEGWQPPSSFPSYLNKTHIALSPLKRNIHHDTTYANKLFQYMACEKPLIVSDCVAQAELVRNERCGLVFRADDAQDLSDKILTLYRNAEEAKAMGERGKNAVLNRWNWNLTVRPLLDIYAHAID